MKKTKLELYGTGWCPKSTLIRNYLQSQWIEFDDFNVEEDKVAEKKVRKLYNGKLKFPTVKYGDDFVKNPSISELNIFINKLNVKG